MIVPMQELPKDIFRKDAVEIAQFLLGKVISCNDCSAMIVETEAYKTDPASHAFKITKRSEIMLKTYGVWYIYFIYGMYNCINITTNGKNNAGAVLIRALEPLEGIEPMKQRRKTDDIHNLCSGPGKLTQALGINRTLNATPINDKIKLYQYKSIPTEQIAASPRIGIKEAKDLLWRFYIKENKFVSWIISK